MAKKETFKKEYILGVGYPWAYGIRDFQQIGLNKAARGVVPKILRWPKELWSLTIPKYELVLRRVKK